MSEGDDILRKPLFSDPGWDAERVDEWSYPKGIVRDGMIASGTDKRTLADQYFDAAEAVASLVLENKVPDYTVANPILYLYRHSVELYLKVAIEKKTGSSVGRVHQLDELVQKAPHVSDAARQRILELHAIDPHSTHLRYGGGGTDFPGPEGWAEMTFFRDSMRALQRHLVDMIERLRFAAG